MKKVKVIISCEHGGNKIPKEFQDLFVKKKALLSTHRGYDIGAFEMASVLFKKCGHYFFHSTTSRLLIELNRSLRHPDLFSSITKHLSSKTKESIKSKYYYPYIEVIEQTILNLIEEKNSIIHISSHSFTPILDGEKRNADIGLLYDPQRENEKKFCRLFKANIVSTSEYKVRFNYPYLGIADGFPNRLRRQYHPQNYMGIEIEVNQKYVIDEREKWENIKQVVAQALDKTIRQFSGFNK